MFLEIATVPGALIGVTATVFLARASFIDALLVALGVVLLAIVPGVLARQNEEFPGSSTPDARSWALHLSGSYVDRVTGRPVTYRAAETSPALGIMFGAGPASGMFGTGGGVFKVLALERYLRVPMKVAT